MKVRFITLISWKMRLRQDLGIEILNQILLDNGYDSETFNFFYNYDNPYTTSTEYSEYVCELGNMPLLLKMVENYKNKRPIEENIEEAIPVEFEVHQPNAINELKKHIESIDISEDDVFCFGTTYISIVPMIYYALKLKSINKNIKTVFGGYHITLSKYVRDIILRLGIADTVVMNDGSGVILDIVEGKKSGLVDGEFVKNVRLPDYNETKLNAYHGWITTMTSVGCPNSCTFCASDRKWLGFDLDYIEEYHMSLLEKYPNVKFYYTDDNINTTIDRFDEIADMIVRIGRPWRAFANPLQLTGDIARKLSGTGCDYLYLGAEGFSNELLKHIGKPGLNVKMVKAGIEVLVKHDITVYLGLIIGLPGESKEIFDMTNETCKELMEKYGKDLIDIIPTAFKIFPNSQHYWTPNKFGIEFEYWEEKYINQIPEISDIVKKVPKKFSVGGISREGTKSRVLNMRKQYGLPPE